jgi:glyoxylase-like metal-dependent hydrolase (beta-lactamase superfamily II)
MTTTNSQSGTNVHEVAKGIFRINTPVPPSVIPGGFSFNQFLLTGDEPLLFHTGPRKMFPLVSEAVASLLPVESLRHIAFSHFEADECGSLNEWLAVAPQAQPVCGRVAALVSVDDVADRPARALADGEVLETGGHSLRWLDAPHLPHGWETGFMFDEKTRTLLCGDLFTQPGPGESPLTEGDILEERAGIAGTPGRDRAHDARVHARQRLDGGRRGVAARALGPARELVILGIRLFACRNTLHMGAPTPFRG